MASMVEMVPPSVAGRMLRGVFSLPEPVKRLIVGAPVRRDGQEL
jgi:acetyl esterase